MSTATLFDLPADATQSVTAFTLRPYQREAIDAIHDAERRGIRRPLIVLPTGAGKTVVFSAVIGERQHLGRAVVIAHREELLTQAAEKIRATSPGLRVGIVKAGRDEHADADVIVASIQTLAREHRREPLIGTIATIVVDEAHHAVAETYRTVLRDLGAWSPTGPLTIGVTATAGERTDNVGLKAVWEKIVYSRGILRMIADGYLTDIEALEIRTDLDLSRVATVGGDYSDGSLGQELTDSGALEAAAAGYVKFARDLQGVAFTPTIAAAHELAEHLSAMDITAEALSGQTPAAERTAILARLRAGTTQVVTNCAVLTEGFDEPSLTCCLLVRPTKSRPLFVQMVGRVLRPHPGKDKAKLLTLYAPPSAGLTTIGSLAGGDPVTVKPGETLTEAVEREAVEERERRVPKPSILSAQHVDLFRRSDAAWLPVAGGCILPAGKTTVFLIPRVGGQWDLAEQAKGSAPVVSASGLTVEMGKALGEELALAVGGRLLSSKDARWRDRQATPAQTEQLRRRRLPACTTSGRASDELARHFAEPIMRQLIATTSTTGSAA